ncbi:MAG TPA: YlxR family protein [Bacillota bacterium]|nr:YlxR family protein [Bacillota bacterium]
MKQKKVPQRTCVGCKNVKAKRELVRVVRDPDGAIDLDTTGKKPGRGAYICPSLSCLDAGLKGGRLANALASPLPPDVVEKIREKIGRDG